MRLQEYLNNKFSTKKEKTKEILISQVIRDKKIFKGIIGEKLDLSEYTNLEMLVINGECLKKPLTSLNISNCKKLITLSCPNNYLKSLDLTNNHWLEKLDISNNKLSQQDLTFLSHLVNLKELKLGNSNARIKTKLRGQNQFVGSLKPLQNIKNLKLLSIRNTKINGSLDFLENMDRLKSLDIARTDVVGGESELFTKRKWKAREFMFEEIEQWSKVGLRIYDYGIAYYLKQKGYNPNTPNIQEIIHQETWQDIHPDFNYRLRRNWEKKSFNKEQVEEWTIAGAELKDYEFVAWLKDIKKESPKWIINYKEDYQILSERFKKYGLCSECNQPNTGENWCRNCNAFRLKKKFAKWTGNSQVIDKFIQEYQIHATDTEKLLEWIPYKQFKNIEYLAEGGFGKVYKARWSMGNIKYWNSRSNYWQREKDYYYEDKRDKKGHNIKVKKSKDYREVVLKILSNSQNITTEFFAEIEKHKIIDDWFNNIVPCYGISQDPETGNYVMVMQYMPGGNLRNYLSENNKNLKGKVAQKEELKQEVKSLRNQSKKTEKFNKGKLLQEKQQKLNELNSEINNLQTKLTLQNKLSCLVKIVQGLKDIHAKNLVHRDFHSGNILKGIEKTSCLITDLGLCKPADELGKEENIYGVMPYVAPEVLRSQPYTQKADVYSFGIIAYEVFSETPPYYSKEHDFNLALEICQGLRPQFQIKIPQLLEDLIEKCWNVDPDQRPTAKELERVLKDWEQGNGEFSQQLQEAEEYNRTLLDSIKHPDYKNKIHKEAVYHSRFLPTNEISKWLHDPKKINEDFYQFKETNEFESCAILTEKNLNLQEKTEDFVDKNHQQTQNYQSIHSQFTEELIKNWINHNFTYNQTQDWINIGLTPEDYNFAHFLKTQKNLTPEEVLNHYSLENLKQEFIQSQQQSQIIHNPPKFN